MSKEHKIDSVLDMLKLSPDEFARMVPDLCAWYAFTRDMDALAAETGVEITHTGFRWIDDGRSGEVHSVLATIGDRVEIIPGSAFEAKEGA